MDGFVHHPYPESAVVPIDLPHPRVRTIGLADYDKLVQPPLRGLRRDPPEGERPADPLRRDRRRDGDPGGQAARLQRSRGRAARPPSRPRPTPIAARSSSPPASPTSPASSSSISATSLPSPAGSRRSATPTARPSRASLRCARPCGGPPAASSARVATPSCGRAAGRRRAGQSPWAGSIPSPSGVGSGGARPNAFASRAASFRSCFRARRSLTACSRLSFSNVWRTSSGPFSPHFRRKARAALRSRLRPRPRRAPAPSTVRARGAAVPGDRAAARRARAVRHAPEPSASRTSSASSTARPAASFALLSFMRLSMARPARSARGEGPANVFELPFVRDRPQPPGGLQQRKRDAQLAVELDDDTVAFGASTRFCSRATTRPTPCAA